MRRKTAYGVTLIELMVAMFIIVLCGFVVLNIFIKASTLYARTSVHIEPQASAMIAFKRMEREIRQAMLISTTTPSPSTWIEILLPKKDANGLNELGVNDEGLIVLQAGNTVCYFLGKKLQLLDPVAKEWLARPAADGSTLFRTESTYNGVNDTFANSRVIVDHVVNPNSAELIGQPSLTREALKHTLYVFTPYDNNGTPEDYTDDKPLANTNLLTVTIIIKTYLQGRPVYHPLWTQFYLRNLKT